MPNSNDQKEVSDLLSKVKQAAEGGLNAREKQILDSLIVLSKKETLARRTNNLLMKIQRTIDELNAKKGMDDFDKWFKAVEPVLTAAEKAVTDLNA